MAREHPLPGHIDSALVYDYDYYSDPLFAREDDLHAVLRRLQREAPPIFWSPALGGYWVIQKYAFVFEAARATDLFSSTRMLIPASSREDEGHPSIPIHFDPPDHGKYRKPLNLIFAPQAMHALAGEIRALAAALVDAVAGDGWCDFVASVAEPLPVMTFMRLMGMEPSRLREFRDLAHRAQVSPDLRVRYDASREVAKVMADVVAEQQKKTPYGDDGGNVLARLIGLRIDGEPISQDDLEGYARLLFFAGIDTVANAISFGMRIVARDRALQDRLRGAPDQIPRAVEELLRAGAPTSPGRIVTRDEVWHGASLRARDRVMLLLPGSNYDPDAFPEPTRIDIDRRNISHNAFNVGPHRCVGAHLARLELRIMYEEWLKRIPYFRPHPDKRERLHTGMVMGVDSLPLVWSARAGPQPSARNAPGA